MRQAMDSFLDLADIVDLKEFIEGWFMDTTSIDDIKHDNMVEFIAYGFYSKELEALTVEEREEIDTFLDRVCAAFGRKAFEPGGYRRIARSLTLTLSLTNALSLERCARSFPGYNAHARFMRHTLEPVRSFHKPLIIYAFMEMIGLFNLGILWWFGFRRLSSRRIARRSRGTMSMFVRDCAPPAGKDRKKDPMVFIHGVGFGVLPYVHFLGRMLANTDRPWIVVEMRHVSMRLSIRHRSVSLQTLANDIVDQMQAVGYEKGLWCVELRTSLSLPLSSHSLAAPVCRLSHSYGTFVTAKILQLHPKAVEWLCLIDPVCCMTCHPKLTRNFVYRSYQGWPLASRRRFMDWVQLLFSRDLTIADTFCRHLNGMDVNVFAHDFPVPEGKKKHLVVLSGQDPLVPSHLVMKQFRGTAHVDVLLNERHGHGDFLFDSKYLAYLVVRIESETGSKFSFPGGPLSRCDFGLDSPFGLSDS